MLKLIDMTTNTSVTPESAGPRAPSAGHVRTRWSLIAEALAVWITGFCLMTYLQTATGGPNGDLVGVRDHDGWYHTKMATLLPKIGNTTEFPWLQFVYFLPDRDKFLSHHFGFHVLLMPFVYLSKWTVGDFLPGGRWCVATYFGLMLVVVNALLAHAGIRWRWIWMLALLFLPHQFFLRHGYVRAIAPSLFLMLLVILMIVKNRPIFAGLAVTAYTFVYLGGVTFVPVIGFAYLFASLVGPDGDRRFPTKMVLACAIGYVIGIAIYPYSGVFEFLRLQVFGSGLSPDIEVGQEWRPYNGVWWFMQMSGVLLGLWGLALTLRLRYGPRLNASETMLLILNFAFLLLTLKARRFIEYWPAFGFLSTAYLAAPLQAQFTRWWESGLADRTGMRSIVTTIVSAAMTGAAAAIVVAVGLAFLVEKYPDSAWLPAFVRRLAEWPDRVAPDWYRMLTNRWLLIAISAYSAYWILTALIGAARQPLADLPDRRRNATERPGLRLGAMAHGAIQSAAIAVLGCGGLVAAAAPALSVTRSDLRSDYDTRAIEKMMEFIQKDSQPGDIIFTDDWDCFGVYFYHNDKNYYIVGLDPKFTHERRPDLWERYVKVTRGQTPSTADVKMPPRDGRSAYIEKVSSTIEDIRDHFKAKYVIVDSDHKPLSRQLARAKNFAELIYPCTKYESCENDKYLVFRIKPTEGLSPAEKAAGLAADGILSLSLMQPSRSDSPSDCYRVDRALNGGPLRAGDETHLRGISQRIGCEIEYEIPDGFARFEATLGVDESQAKGPVLARVLLDGKIAHEVELRDGGTVPTPVQVVVGGAKKLTLISEAVLPASASSSPAHDDRQSELNWASARLVLP